MRQFYIILSFILSLPLFASAQLHYPIRTTTIVTPPVPYTLDGFVSQPGRLMLHIMVDDITLSQYPVKLRLHIEGNGIRITTNPNTPQQPVYLDGGVVTQLTGPDLELFFNPSNLLFQGYSQSEYNRNGRLPEGVYRIRFEVLDYYRNFQVSSAIPAVAMLSLTGAPVLTFPANRSEVDIDMTPVLRFSWMAVFSAIPDALISYRFRLWQVRPDSRDPYEIVRVTSPLYETTTHETALLYDGSMPPLTRGSRYVWQVTAIDEGGKVLFKNNGDSDIFTLRYGKQCSAPSAVITKVTHNSVAVSWNSDPSVREYAVRYKKEDATGWQEVTTRQAGITIEGLDHSALYELTVTGNCGTETSENERVLRFKTDRFVDYSCGASAPGINLENREPLPALHRFDEFMAAGFYIEVTEVSGSNGVFSGRGIASVPYLNFLQFEVVFNGITINSDHRMIDGKVVFVYDEATGMIIGGDMGRGDDPAESGPEAYNHQEALEYIAGQVITLDEDVQTVTIDNKGQVTVVTESGQKKSYLVGENQTLAIITPQSTTVVDQASGQVFHAPNAAPGSASNVRTPAQSKIHGCLVNFRPLATQRFGFDAVGNGVVKPNSYFKRDRGGNAVPWKSLETGNSDLVTMLSTGDCPPDSLRLIRESGILTPTKPGSNNTLELLLTGGFEGQEELLTVARATLLHINDTTGSEILTEAGALGVVSYRRSTQNVVLVPVNSAGFPTQGTDRSVIIRRLNEIYGAAVVSWNVHIDNPIEVGRINEEDFKVEGTALLSKYTSDMNRVIRAYKRDRVTDDNTMYLFFMEIPNLGSNRKGFMPLAGNYGFIFNFEARDLELIAHELAHGAFNLRHTFSDKAQHYFPQNQTANLMDYAGGTELWKYQWDLIHNPERILFSWAQSEEEGAAIQNLADGNYYSITENKWENYAFLSPVGTAINITGATHVKFNEDGAVLNFKKDGKTYYGVHSVGTQRFMGYLSQDDKSILNEHSLLTSEFETEFNQKKYTGITYAAKDKEVIAYFKQKDGENYLDCLRKATWKNETVATSYTGIANPPFISEDAVSLDISGNQCVNYAAEGVHDGVGKDIFINLKNVITEEQKPQLVELANYFTDSISNRKFAFYGYGLEDYYSSGAFNEQIILYLKNNKIYSKDLLKQKFPYIVTQAREFGYIFSTKDLWAGIPVGYNRISRDYIRDGIYEYSLADLKAREEYFAEESIFKKAIIKFEEAGDAQPLATHENYEQYVAKWGTDAALFAWAEYAARTADPVLKAYMAYRFLPQLIAEVGIDAVINKIIKEFGEEEAKRFIKGAAMEATMYYSVAELLGTSIDWKDFTLDVTMAGLRNTVYIGEDMQAWAACLQGIELNTAIELIDNIESKDINAITNSLISLSVQCFIPLVFEKYLGNKSSDLYRATQRSSATKLTKFFNKLKLSEAVQADLLFLSKNVDEIAGSRGVKWVQEMKRLMPTESGSRAYDLLINASFDISKLSWRNFERLSNIVSKLDDNAAKSLEDLFKGSLDVNRMLIYLEKSGSSLAQYSKVMDDIVQKNLFSGTITLSGGKTISKLDFVKNYAGEATDLIAYYHKEAGGKQYFLKYHPASNQGAVIVIDSYSKVIVDAECRILVNVTQQELQAYTEQKVKDE